MSETTQLNTEITKQQETSVTTQRVQKRGVRMTKNGRYKSRAERGPFLLKIKVKRFRISRFINRISHYTIRVLKRRSKEINENIVVRYYDLFTSFYVKK